MEEVQSPIITLISEIIILALTGIITTSTILLRKRIMEKISKWLETVSGITIYTHGHLGKNELEKAKDINAMLAELRLKTNADRAQVFEFHNGSVYTSKNQMWKTSCTYEIVDTVQSSYKDLQNMLPSLVTDILAPMFDDDDDLSEHSGVYRCSPRACVCSNKDGCKLPHGVYFYRVNGMKPSYAKGLLNNHKVAYMLQTPLIDANDNVVGFVSLDWCWEESKPADIECHSELICQTATTIAYRIRPFKVK